MIHIRFFRICIDAEDEFEIENRKPDIRRNIAVPADKRLGYMIQKLCQADDEQNPKAENSADVRREIGPDDGAQKKRSSQDAAADRIDGQHRGQRDLDFTAAVRKAGDKSIQGESSRQKNGLGYHHCRIHFLTCLSVIFPRLIHVIHGAGRTSPV